MTTDYATRKGALLARMEHRCIEPGLWLVEGYQVRRSPTGWIIVWEFGVSFEKFVTFEDAIQAVADKIEIDNG